MITGRLPYEGDSPVAVAIQHINSIPLYPREIDPEIPEALEAITMKAMASDVNQRYISADAMLADLEEFRKNPSINFDYTPADLLISEGDEPTQILGANTPHTVRTQPAHGARSPEDTYVSPAPHPRKSRPARVEDDYDDYPERGGSRLPIILAIVAVAVFVAGIGVFLWVSFFGGAGETLYAVPSLLGKTLEEARADASVVSANFQIVEGGETDSNRPVGQIVSQDPVEGRNAAAGATITVILSNGSGYADEEARQMPDLVEQDVRLAVSSLAALGYSEEAGNLVIQKEYSEDIAKDHVISTVPTKDTDLTDVAQVTLVVSDGEETLPVTVISFLDMTEEDARTAATDLGLDPVFEGSEYSSEYEEGDVCWQSIANNTQVAEGTTIRFRVSLGPDPAATPSPSVEPTPEATPAPTPDDGEEELKPYTINVNLPRDGRESVQVSVTVGNGQYSYSNTYDTIMQSIPITVYGSGTQEIRVYFDGELAETSTHDFG